MVWSATGQLQATAEITVTVRWIPGHIHVPCMGRVGKENNSSPTERP